VVGEIDRRFRRSSRQDLKNEKPGRSLEPFRVGEVLTAAKLTKLVDAQNRTTSFGAAQQINGLRDRVTGIFEARVVDERDDFLICELFEYSGNPERIIVAKPFTLRRRPHESFGRGDIAFEYSDTPGQRTATFTDPSTGDTASAAHFISPAYVPRSGSDPGDLLYVTNNIVGGVALFAGTFELEGGVAPEHFIDMNTDGRQWAAEVPCEPAVELSTDPTATAG